MKVVGILLCAGASQRMGFCKLTAPLFGRSAIERSAEALLKGGVDELVFVVSEATAEAVDRLNLPKTVVFGGERRQDSVRNGLCAACGDIALIHDAARCFVSPELVRQTIESAAQYGSGVAALPVTDTILREGKPAAAVPREGLWRMQTPQTFDYQGIKNAYTIDMDATDDASLFAASGGRLHFVLGSEDNFKLTAPADWERAYALLSRETLFGTGFDTHRLVPGRKLILGGVDIPFEKGLLGHSDADVLLHAIADALLGAAALGDIGRHFPDTDPQYRGADSRKLLRFCAGLVQKRDMYPLNIDATVICQSPKLAPYIDLMRSNIASDCHIPVNRVSVKATTTEGMNDEGRGECISAQAVASLGRA
ncbi:MAG: 2-C-methyl-D-erythritol 2,4-cyclodiphosphate synthase [Clostridia bacterium]|nr:2-C-methyl-D-erythritol 2,4-cyclodiphosphate synthase [Clostridia bacterium]